MVLFFNYLFFNGEGLLMYKHFHYIIFILFLICV